MDRIRRLKQQGLFEVDRMGYSIPWDHELLRMERTYNFDRWEELTRDRYHSGKGRRERDPVLKLKMLVLQQLYGWRDRDMEKQLNENLVLRHFCELPLNESAPHYSQLSRMRKKMGEKRLALLMADLVKVAREQGLITDRWSVVDATHMVADVSPSRQAVSNKKSQMSWEQRDPEAWRKKDPKPPTDGDARWGAKSREKIFFGYKLHAAMDAKSYLLTKLHVTSGEVYDGHHLVHVLETRAKNITADKAYDDRVNHVMVNLLGIRSWIFRKKKTAAPWLTNIRSNIERKFGEAKGKHRFERCRYRGLEAVTVQCYLMAMALNLKRMATMTC